MFREVEFVLYRKGLMELFLVTSPPGTIMVTMWRKYLGGSSLSFHQFGSRLVYGPFFFWGGVLKSIIILVEFFSFSKKMNKCVLKVTVNDNDDFLIGGVHDLDQGWIKDVRKHGAKIVPRLLFDRLQPQNVLPSFNLSGL